MKIKLDGLELIVNSFTETKFVSEPTGNELRKLNVEVVISGNENVEKFNEIIAKAGFDVQVLSDEENYDFRGKLGYDFNLGNKIVVNGNDNYSVVVLEIVENDKDILEDWNFIVGVCEGVIMNRLLARSLIELLIDKGIFARDEFDQKVGMVRERDYEGLKKYLFYGIPEK